MISYLGGSGGSIGANAEGGRYQLTRSTGYGRFSRIRILRAYFTMGCALGHVRVELFDDGG